MKTSAGYSLFILLTLFIIGCKPGEDPVTVTVQNFTITIDENPTAGQSLGMITGTTSKGSVTFTITSQSVTGAFAINATSGELTVANASLFDFEVNPTLTAVITAANGAISATGNVTVTLNNVPDAVNTQDATISLDENPAAATHITDVSATTDSGTLSYTISSQNPAGAFALDGATGEVTIADETKFDFETNPTLSIVVTASNGTVSDDGTITVNLNNVLEILTTQDETVTIDENPSNGQAIVTVTSVTDLGTPSFAIVNESVNGAFSIDMTSGALTVANPALFDYEQNTSLTATVNVTNGAMTATSIVTVNLNDVFELTWTQVTAQGSFGDRYSPGFIWFNNKFWIIGGIKGITRLNEVWSSSDGISWTQESIAGNIFSPRNAFDIIEFNSKMWVIGGFTDNGRTNEIWSSPDGTTWTQETPIGNVFTPRGNYESIVFNNKLWLLGGNINAGDPTNEVWSTPDGVNWTQETTTNTFTPAMGLQAVVLNGKIFVMGGNSHDNDQLLVTQNEVWSSSDGLAWTKENATNHFSPRWLHGAVVLNNQIWVIGGFTGTDQSKEVWVSSDGVSWTDLSNHSTFAIRESFGILVLNNQIWFAGGSNGNGILADIWRSN